MSAKLRKRKKRQECPLTRWSDISDCYYEYLPILKSRRDKDKEPRGLFGGDSPRPAAWRKKDAKEGTGPLMPSNYRALQYG